MMYFYKSYKIYSPAAKKTALNYRHHQYGEVFEECELRTPPTDDKCLGYVMGVKRESLTHLHPTNYKPKLYSTIDGIYKAALALRIPRNDVIVYSVLPTGKNYPVPKTEYAHLDPQQITEALKDLPGKPKVTFEWKNKHHLTVHIKAI